MKQTEPNRLNRMYRLRDLPQFVGLQRTVIAEMIKAFRANRCACFTLFHAPEGENDDVTHTG